MSGKIINQSSNTIILAGIVSFTIIVVAAIWFLSQSNTPAPTPPTVAAPVAQDSMAGHHSGNNAQASTAALAALVGQPAPSFTLTDRSGQVYNNETSKGKNVVLFFNEGLMCYPACWNQIAQLAEDDRFTDQTTVVLSVVVDPMKDWQRAVDKMPELAKATVVFDTNKKVSAAFGVLTTPSSMHFGSLPGHSYVVIDQDGIVRHVYDDPRMALHNDQLVAELAKLN
ncbi:MAG: redoxin domain-containing protein [Patescibacteria group bacterium]